jgi:hypothetical protein
MIKFGIKKSTNKNKKYDALFSDDEGNQKKISFGAIRPNGIPYEDFTTHGDVERKNRYISRHKKNEDWTTPFNAGSLSRFLLWNKPSLKLSVQDFKKRFNLI